MHKININLIQQLRKKTGIGILECKNALIQTNNLKEAITWLREKGIVKSIKNNDKHTKFGSISMHITSSYAFIIEINCETDFIAKSKEFKTLMNNVLKKMLALKIHANKINIFNNDINTDIISITDTAKQIIKENIIIKRYIKLTKGNFFGGYIHHDGNIGVIIAMDIVKHNPQYNPIISQLAQDLSMQIAATKPLAINKESIHQKTIEEEKNIILKQTLKKHKNQQIINNIIKGYMKKFFTTHCLLNQQFIKNQKITIQEIIDLTSKKINSKIIINKFIYFKIGDM